MSPLEILLFTLTLLVMVIGFAGAVLPGLPGTPLIAVAALVHRWVLGARRRRQYAGPPGAGKARSCLPRRAAAVGPPPGGPPNTPRRTRPTSGPGSPVVGSAS
ncbi:MAG: hypothetical protein ACKOKG_15700, partial [Verrucomicrobiota bacterium]